MSSAAEGTACDGGTWATFPFKLSEGFGRVSELQSQQLQASVPQLALRSSTSACPYSSTAHAAVCRACQVSQGNAMTVSWML